jgi:predicted DsbA family dithiol-disulfide isomerase
MQRELDIQIWSDIACPWCYVGKRRLESALAEFPHRESVRITWRAFELDPSAPRVRPADVGYAERLAKKYGTSTTQAQGMLQKMTDTGALDGIEFRFDRAQSGNTFDAHRLLHFAHEHDPEGSLQDRLKERFLHAYMTEGEAIGEPDVLVRLATEVGIEEKEASRIVTTDAFATNVRSDEAEARELGISGVPFFAFGGRYGVSGAQPKAALLEVLEKSWTETVARLEPAASEGAACGPDGCA